MIKINFVDNSYLQLTGNQRMIQQVKEAFKFRVDGYMFHPAFKTGWDGYIRLIDRHNRVTSGLREDIMSFMDNNDIPYEDDDKFKVQHNYTKEYVMDWIDSLEIMNDRGDKIDPYWYQKDAVWEFVRKARTTLLFPTSSGKSLIQALCVRFFLDHLGDGNVLIILPRTALVYQLHDDFLDYGLFTKDEINTVADGSKYDHSKRVNLSTWQSAVRFGKKVYDNLEFMMVDECHNAKARSVQTIGTKAVNAPYRVGLTGTLGEEETEQNQANILQIIGLFGKVFRPVTTMELIEHGIATDIKIINLFLQYNNEFCEKVNGVPYKSEVDILTGLKPRSEIITDLALNLASRKENVFLMFRYEKHGLSLLEMLKEKADKFGVDPKEIYFINGKIDTDIRREIQKNAEEVQGTIIVASEKTFSEGISIRNLHHAIFSSPLKSMITVLQAVGRLLRLHESKDIAYLWDFVDDIALKDRKGRPNPKKFNYALKHGLKRMEYYNQEGFNREVRKIKL